MKNFIFGILFDTIGLPLIESLVELVQIKIEKRKGITALEVAKINKDIAKTTQNQEESNCATTIGFEIPTCEEEFEEDDDF